MIGDGGPPLVRKVFPRRESMLRRSVFHLYIQDTLSSRAKVSCILVLHIITCKSYKMERHRRSFKHSKIHIYIYVFLSCPQDTLLSRGLGLAECARAKVSCQNLGFSNHLHPLVRVCPNFQNHFPTSASGFFNSYTFSFLLIKTKFIAQFLFL